MERNPDVVLAGLRRLENRRYGLRIADVPADSMRAAELVAASQQEGLRVFTLVSPVACSHRTGRTPICL